MQNYIRALFADDSDSDRGIGLGSRTRRSSRLGRSSGRFGASRYSPDMDSDYDVDEGFGGSGRRSRSYGRKNSSDDDLFQEQGGFGSQRRSRVRGNLRDDDLFQEQGEFGSQRRSRVRGNLRDDDMFQEQGEFGSQRRSRVRGNFRDADLNQQDGFGSGRRSNSTQKIVVNELTHDRERDEFQARLLKKLIKSRKNNRNRNLIVQALIAGERVPSQQICQLLCEDWVLDNMTEGLATRILDDQVNNRNADQIIKDYCKGRVHRPRRGQADTERENITFNQFLGKAVKRATHPQFIQSLAKGGLVDDFIESLIETQQRYA